MKVLGFERRGRPAGPHTLRESLFEDRSSLPISAACLVANSIREKLSALFRGAVALRLLEPTIPNPQAWTAIAADAEIFGIQGRLCDAAIVLQRCDALLLATTLFGEAQSPPRNLSPLENELLFRTVRTLATTFTPLCGLGSDWLPARINALGGFVTYFELLIDAPVKARIGIAMSRDALSSPIPEIASTRLEDIGVELKVEIAQGALDAAALLHLRPGSCVKLETPIGAPATFCAGSRVLGRGEFGEFEGTRALVVQ